MEYTEFYQQIIDNNKPEALNSIEASLKEFQQYIIKEKINFYLKVRKDPSIIHKALDELPILYEKNKKIFFSSLSLKYNLPANNDLFQTNINFTKKNKEMIYVLWAFELKEVQDNSEKQFNQLITDISKIQFCLYFIKYKLLNSHNKCLCL